jgi:hypothetical protein
MQVCASLMYADILEGIYYLQVCASLMYADILEGIYYLQVCASLMYADILEGICMEVCMYIVCRWYFFYLAHIEVDTIQWPTAPSLTPS